MKQARFMHSKKTSRSWDRLGKIYRMVGATPMNWPMLQLNGMLNITFSYSYKSTLHLNLTNVDYMLFISIVQGRNHKLICVC